MKKHFSLAMMLCVFAFGALFLLAAPATVLAAAPLVSTLTPADNAFNIDVDADLVIVFDQAVDAESGDILLYDSNDTEIFSFDVTSEISGSGTTTITINPGGDLASATAYYVQIEATAFDNALSESYAGITDTTTWNFSTKNTNPSTLVNPPSDVPQESTSTPDPVVEEVPEVTEPETEETPEPETTEVIDSPEAVVPEVIAYLPRLVRTANNSAVYQINEDGTRSAFMTADIYFSYYDNFASVETITDQAMNEYPLGTPVLQKPGKVIKFETSSKVYLVQDDGSLSWITNETAFTNRGLSFLDVEVLFDSLFPVYTIGENITE